MVGLTLAWPDVLSRLTRREPLTEQEAEATLASVLAGEATPAQIGAFLTLLHAKGETVAEVTGLARAMVQAAVPLDLAGGHDGVVDLVGTGGDRLSSINVTTLAALVVAGCGVTVCKHGGRSASSSVGSADVLEALGVGIEIGPGLDAVVLDQHKFKQMLYNLLSNAVKFTDDDGQVDIYARRLDSHWFEVGVRDTGIGIKAEDLGRLFNEFEQLDSGTARRFEGTGLGLALTKKIIEFQGGRVSVESEPDHGSVFTVVLPVITERRKTE